MMRSYCNIGEDVFLQNVQIKVQYEQRGSFGLKGEVNPIFFIPPLGQNWAN